MYNIIIESLGVYLPERVVSTREIVRGCRHPVMFPLERFTGVVSRRVADETEFSLDLARKAAQACFENSRHCPADIDLLICCNISRHDEANTFSFEPSTASKLQRDLDLQNAISFDISNACAGMFTAIQVASTFLKTGAARLAMIVSGECITPLTRVAQKTVKGFMDPQLACLTLGDAGAAIILEEGTNDTTGFHAIEMYTESQYSSYCIAKAVVTEEGTPSPHMLTDSIRLTAVTIGQAINHTVSVMRRHNWTEESFRHIIMHQTSKTSLGDAVREMNRLARRRVCRNDNVVYNVAERGNTATTSHFVAVYDTILGGRIDDGSSVVFSITGSGLTIGTALYTFDDLPTRLRQSHQNMIAVAKAPALPKTRTPDTPRVRIESLGSIPEWQSVPSSTLEMTTVAAEECFEVSRHDRSAIDLLLYAGVYRTDYVGEPAIAALLADALDINRAVSTPEDHKTFALDILNSGVGFLSACYAAIQMIRSGAFGVAMVAASEVENNQGVLPENLRGICETASAVILEESPDEEGFGSFLFKSYPGYIDALTSVAIGHQGQVCLCIQRNSNLEDYYLECIADAVGKFLELEKTCAAAIDVVFCPQLSPQFITNLSHALNISRSKFVDLTRYGQDLFTSSLVYSMQYAQQCDLTGAGKRGLIVGVGAGIQVGCALYHF